MNASTRPSRSLPSRIMDEIAASFTVRHVQTPASRLRGFDVEEPASEAVDIMKSHTFDFAPAYRGGRLLGRVARDDLVDATTVGDALQPLAGHYIVSAHSPMTELLRWLTSDPWLLTVDGRDISGVVTPSDLNRQASRTYLYMLVVDLELTLAAAIRDHFEDQSDAMELLGEAARADIEKLASEARTTNLDPDLVSFMNLSNLLHIAGKTPAIRQEMFGYETRSSWKKDTGAFIEIRHDVMHPVRPLLNDQDGIERLVDLEGRLRSFLSKG